MKNDNKNRRLITTHAIALVACCLWPTPPTRLFGDEAVGPTDRVNILYIYVDDMGWGSLGPNGQWQRRDAGLPHLRTPNLDQMARDGLNFRRGYGCHVCSPARSSQQSGFHQGHTFADRNDRDNAKKAMRAEDRLIGDVLSRAGYATGYWGKWGYGGSQDRRQPEIVNVQTLPTSHGYQDVLAELHHVRAHTFFQPTLWRSPAPAGSPGNLHLVPNSMAGYRTDDRYPDSPARQRDPDYPDVAYCDDAYAFAALDFVRVRAKRYRDTGQPFFGLLACQIPHAPFQEIQRLPEWDEAYRDAPWFDSLSEQAKCWAAMLSRIDGHIGNLLAALDDPNGDGKDDDSIREDTLVIFQSDNGGPGGDSVTQFAANGILRGVKGTIEEGGIRVPLLMRWPKYIRSGGTFQPGTSTDRVVDVTDLLPTFCDLAGVAAPLGIDGVSIAPTLTGRGLARKREFLIHEAGRGQSIIQGRWKLKRSTKGQLSLFDLEDDPGEEQDVAPEHPGLVDELEKRLLGERVTEPPGFAITYHDWQGNDGDAIDDADSWTAYEYSNAGRVYQRDAGGPTSSWVAVLKHPGNQPATAVAGRDAGFLALQVGSSDERIDGHDDPIGSQTLEVADGVTVSGRNEIRIAPSGRIRVDGGTLETLRWIENAQPATLTGHGTLAGTLINAGTFAVVPAAGAVNPGDVTWSVEGDFHQLSRGSVTVGRLDPRGTAIETSGVARLDGELVVDEAALGGMSPGESAVLIKATSVRGRFRNTEHGIVTPAGTRYHVRYTPTSVRVTKD